MGVTAHPIRVGVGGWTFDPWDETFYPADLPKKKQLDFMSRHTTANEANGTFYRTQSPETFQKWHDESAPGFVFALKAPRYAVNRRVLAEAGESIARFADSGIARLGEKLGPILWQFAPTKAFDPADMAAFLDLLPARAEDLPLRHAVEPRHPSFADPAFAALCRERSIAIVRAGDSDYPEIAEATADFAYWRIMGTTEAAGGYAPAALDAWAERARAEAAERPLFLFVISGEKRHNPAAAQALIARLA